MKNIIKILIISLFAVFTMTGCTTNVAYTFSVETGDSITVQLDTSDGYKMSNKVPFEISLDGTVLTTGKFIEGKYYDDYLSSIKGDANATLIDESKRDDLEYIFYSYNGSEYNYVINIIGTKTGVILSSKDANSAKEVFGLLSIYEAE